MSGKELRRGLVDLGHRLLVRKIWSTDIVVEFRCDAACHVWVPSSTDLCPKQADLLP